MICLENRFCQRVLNEFVQVTERTDISSFMGDDDSSWEELEEVVEPSVGTGGSTYTGGSKTEKNMSLLKGWFWVSSSKS